MCVSLKYMHTKYVYKFNRPNPLSDPYPANKLVSQCPNDSILNKRNKIACSRGILLESPGLGTVNREKQTTAYT